MSTISTSVTAERTLISREAARMVDVCMGRVGTKDRIGYYLMVMRPDRLGVAPDALEIEPYDEIERLVANATDLETGDRQGRWVGAYKAEYCSGGPGLTNIKLASITLIGNLSELIAAEKLVPPVERLRRHRQRNLVTTGSVR